VKWEAGLVNGVGLAWIAGGLITLITLAGTGDLVGANALLPVFPSGVGVALLSYNKSRLARWARTCAAQMQRIVDRTQTLLATDPALEAMRENQPGEA
jgi:hypothetical protein